MFIRACMFSPLFYGCSNSWQTEAWSMRGNLSLPRLKTGSFQFQPLLKVNIKKRSWMLPLLLLRSIARGPQALRPLSLGWLERKALLWADPENQLHLPHQPLTFLKIGTGNLVGTKYLRSDCDPLLAHPYTGGGDIWFRNASPLHFSENFLLPLTTTRAISI